MKVRRSDEKLQEPLSVCLHSIREHDQLSCVVEHHTHSLIAQLIAESVFVAVVNPFANPEDGIGSGLTVFIPQVMQVALQLGGKELGQLLVQIFQVRLLNISARCHHSGGSDCVVQVFLQEGRFVVRFV